VTPDKIPPIRRLIFATPGFHQALLTPLLAGRTLTWADIETRAKVVVITENFARERWGEPAAAIGKRIAPLPGTDLTRPPLWYEIVGVVGDSRYDGPDKPAPSVVYWPLVLEDYWGAPLFVPRSVEIAVRTSGLEPAPLIRGVEQAVWSMNAHLPLANVGTLAEALDRSMARSAFAMVMLSMAGLVALVLGLVGIYGVVSFIVTERTQEIGLRIALGADPSRVRRMVVGQAMAVAGVGIGIGLVAAMGLSRAMTGILHGVRPLDPMTYAGVAIALALVAIGASWLPARRASGLDPVRALRAE